VTRIVRTSVLDLGVAAAVAFPTVMDAWWNEPGTRQADWLTYALAAVSIGAVMVRRSWPLAASLVCGGALTGWYVLGHHGQLLNLPTMVALYTVAAQGDRRRSAVVAVVAAAWAAGVSLATGSPSGTPAAEAAWPVLALLLGEVVRMRREQLAEYADRAVRAEADRDAEARRRVQDERLRIARELHDVVAHTVAAMNVQAGLAAEAFDERPEVARAAIAQVRASGREAMAELHATVALLRDDRHVPVDPVPRLDELDRLAARASTGDLVVDVDREGVADVPPMVEIAAYRIVQEALTNVIRHSGARRAQVRLRCARGNLEVEVTDDGRGRVPADGAAGGRAGFGLVGMSERAASVGGRLDLGPGDDGGFRVRAVLPVVAVRGGPARAVD
jgi:signal transduction histidine kinase